MSHSPSGSWAPTPEITLESDSFSSGQVLSKLWMAETLEKVIPQNRRLKIACYASWYGWLAFFLFLRGKLPIERVVCYDESEAATAKARVIHESFGIQGRFAAHQMNVNQLSLGTLREHLGGPADLIVNTSVEHFTDDQWYRNLAPGQWVALQACNMKIHDHVRTVHSVTELVERFPLSEIAFSGSKPFRYSNWGFDRFMLIGRV